ncbi:MAG: sugar ABC transporter ATP-binding protein [Candidatus Humimicrobiaceae bacterium]
MDNDFLRLENVSKSFIGVEALKNVSLTIKKGEIHGLVGENGSGKSTLSKIIAGVLNPDPGAKIFIEGKPAYSLSSIESIRKGIEVIFQEFSLLENLSVAENISIGKIVERGEHLVNWRRIKKDAETILDMLGLKIDSETNVGDLTIARQQLVAIGRAISCDVKLLIMDEPTSSLSQDDTNNLFKIIKKLNQEGISIIFISHKLDEVLEVSDRITVLRDGNIVGTFERTELDSNKIISLMIGGKIIETIFKPKKIGKLLLELKSLSKRGSYKDISLKLYSNEILGITGLLGSGKTELALSIFGFNKPDSGKIIFDGSEIKILSPNHAKTLGIGYISEDRQRESLIMIQAVSINIIITIIGSILNKIKLLSSKKINEVANIWINKLKIKVPFNEVKVNKLSGGNQQRVALAKWLAINPKILILDNPTAGIDVSAKSEIYKILHDLADQGMGIILISPEFKEIMENTNRIIVMRRGKIVHEFETDKTTKEEIIEKSINASHVK